MQTDLDQAKDFQVPVHAAFIMDGNGRWALGKGLERFQGHAKGADVCEKTVRFCKDLGIKYCTLYAFSTENWKRPSEEVGFLFQTLIYYLETKSLEMIENGVRIRFTGHIEALPQKAFDCAKKIEESSQNCRDFQMIIALNYGGRQEIWDSFLRMHRSIKNDQSLAQKLVYDNPEMIRSFLNLPDVPDPDILIRTGGEMRLSNFLLWEIAYTELFFSDTMWPDFSEEEFTKILKEYSKRQRRFGGLKTK